jgi:HSP20 family protein
MAESKGSATDRNQAQQQAGGQERGGQALQRRTGSTDLLAANPFQFMQRMSDEMDRLFGRVFGDLGAGRSLAGRSFFGGGLPSMDQPAWSPRIEAFQEGDKFIVRAELPGLKKDDVEVNVTEDALMIQGQRQDERKEEREGFYHSERSYGSFYRTIPLPEGTIPDTADASFKDGVLEIRLQAPPHEVSRGRKIEIKEQEQRTGK